MMPIPPVFLALGGGALLVAGFVGGWSTRDWKCEAAEAKELRREAEARDLMQQWLNQVSTDYEKERAHASARHDDRQQRIRTIYRDRPLPGPDCAVPDDAVRVLEQARAEANARIAAEPQPALPADPAAAGAVPRP